MAANFKKKKPCASSRNPSIPIGSKLSLSSNQLLISSGVPSLDNVLGGGLPVGSLLLIEEDAHGTFSDILLRYFMAEGIFCGHGLLLASSCDEKADEILKKIPTPVEDEKTTEEQNPSKLTKDEEELKIAWRYKHLPTNEVPRRSPKFGNYFDLSKSMDHSTISGQFIKKILPNNTAMDVSHQINSKIKPAHRSVLEQVKRILKDYQINGSSPGKNILRIAIQSLGSPLWQDSSSVSEIVVSLCWFLLALKSLLRASFGVCIVTVPVHLFQDDAYTRRLEKCADSVVHLESFAGSKNESNPAFKDYDGLIHIRKEIRINCLLGHDIDTSDWAFKLKRKKFCIEKLHLPPDLSETVSRTQNEPKKIQQLDEKKFCSKNLSGSSNAFDF